MLVRLVEYVIDDMVCEQVVSNQYRRNVDRKGQFFRRASMSSLGSSRRGSITATTEPTTPLSRVGSLDFRRDSLNTQFGD